MRVLDPDQKYASKSLLPMHGRRVLDWQLDALCNSSLVGEIFLIGLTKEEFPFSKKVSYIPFPTTTTILEKILRGSEIIRQENPDLDHLIICTGDVPGMTAESINLFLETITKNKDIDVLISGVPEDITEEYFPEHNRVVARFSDRDIYPGEMLALRHTIIPVLKKEINQLSVTRRQFNRRSDTSKLMPLMRYLAKKPRLWLIIIRYLTGCLSVRALEKDISQIYQMEFRTVIIPDPGFGMDLDLPEDFQRLTEFIARTKLQKV
jgi:NDP-sugar pyrophosphorylase family protein